MVQGILGLGRALGMSVTAEGVETEQQLDVLPTDAFDEVQGDLLGLPLDIASVRDLLGSASLTHVEPTKDDSEPVK